MDTVFVENFLNENFFLDENFLHSMNFSSKREFLFGTKMFLPALYCLRRLNSGGFSKIRFR